MCQNGQKKYVLTYQIELQHVHMRKGPSFCGSNNVRQSFFYKIINEIEKSNERTSGRILMPVVEGRIDPS